MKPLKQLSIMRRGWMLHELFPDEIPELLVYVENLCITLQEDESINRKAWQNTTITFSRWLELAADVAATIRKHGPLLRTDSQLFGEQLFEGEKAFFMAYALTLYAKTIKPETEDLSLMILILFRYVYKMIIG